MQLVTISTEIIIIAVLSFALILLLFFVFKKSSSAGFIKDLQLMFVRELRSQQDNIDVKLSSHNKENLSTINELNNRLAVIRSHEETISKLNQDVLQLNQTLANPISRGVFGETQLENLLANILPSSAYDLQVNLASGFRADCLVKLPYPPGNIVIDAKFPYKAWLEITKARSSALRQDALLKMARSIKIHIKDVAKYNLTNDTANYAIMFIPAEAVFATIHSELPEIVEEAYIKKVFFASPSTLFAILNTVRAVLKDIQVVEHSKKIRMEVEHIAKDATNIQLHSGKILKSFNDLSNNIETLAKMGDKLSKKAGKIIEVEDDDESLTFDSEVDKIKVEQ